ncbi:MAG: DsbA family oxidoreductase [Microthrixaceae bacterium]
MVPVEVFADVGCPFAHVGLLRFVAARTERGSEATLVVRAWPLEVVNGQPLDAAFIAEEIVEIRPQIPHDLFAGFDPDSFPSTSIPAMALASASCAKDPHLGELVSLELRHLLFELGSDVADPEVLTQVAERYGIDFDPADGEANTAAVMAEHARGQELGVVGSPHFFTADGGFFCPALDVGRGPAGRLRVNADIEGFEQFLAAAID